MLDSRSSACRIPDNDKVRDSAIVSNPPLYAMLFEAFGGSIFEREKFVFGDVNIGCPLIPKLVSAYNFN